eukprot:322561-Chlamydomonas_euryale.AAC.6
MRGIGVVAVASWPLRRGLTHGLPCREYRYILVYPQGCDVCNHLSLFLCVADYDKLLPGAEIAAARAIPPRPYAPSTYMHGDFNANFSPATAFIGRTRMVNGVVHRRLEPLCTVYDCSCEPGPKEVKILRCGMAGGKHVRTAWQAHACSSSALHACPAATLAPGGIRWLPQLLVPPFADTLHVFCKKEHDWGWKKFMELSKVLDGFTVADTLVIKAQVQVIM